MGTSIQLPNTQVQGQAIQASYNSAATLVTIPALALPWGKFVARSRATAGYWYGCYGGATPSASVHDFVIQPGDVEQRDNPTIGAIKLIAVGTNNTLEWSLSYFLE
jgi:hypothetical protein